MNVIAGLLAHSPPGWSVHGIAYTSSVPGETACYYGREIAVSDQRKTMRLWSRSYRELVTSQTSLISCVCKYFTKERQHAVDVIRAPLLRKKRRLNYCQFGYTQRNEATRAKEGVKFKENIHDAGNNWTFMNIGTCDEREGRRLEKIGIEKNTRAQAKN